VEHGHGAVASGEDGYARVGPRGAVVAGEEGYAAVGRRGVVVGNQYESYDAWRAAMDNDYVAGQFLWTGFDFLGEAGEWPMHGSAAGLCDTRGFLKPEAWQRAALWSSKPVLHLAVSRGGSERNSPGMRGVRAHWNWASARSPVNVTAFSNCEEVELRLNGRVLATQKVRVERLTTFSVPFEPGELEAVGRNAGKEVIRAKLQTAGSPSQLRVELDSAEVSAGKRSAIHVIISVVDERGVLVPDECTAEARLVEGIAVHGVRHLAQVMRGLKRVADVRRVQRART